MERIIRDLQKDLRNIIEGKKPRVLRGKTLMVRVLCVDCGLRGGRGVHK